MAFWFISFATKGEVIGATVVIANTAGHALAEATRLGLNPGGEATILNVPADAPVMKLLNRLASKEELITEPKTGE
jgi:hypothetical protein